MEDKLLTTKDLAARWGLTDAQVRTMIKTEGVPILQLRRSPKNVHWAAVRVRESSLAAWEVERERALAPAFTPRPSAPRPIVKRTAAHRFLGSY